MGYMPGPATYVPMIKQLLLYWPARRSLAMLTRLRHESVY